MKLNISKPDFAKLAQNSFLKEDQTPFENYIASLKSAIRINNEKVETAYTILFVDNTDNEGGTEGGALSKKHLALLANAPFNLFVYPAGNQICIAVFRV